METKTNNAWLLTGGNLGDRETLLQEAKSAIGLRCGPVVKASGLYQTAAWGLEDQAPFLNEVLQVQTTLSPTELLHAALAIEESLGRRRGAKYGPRTIDIDILFYNDAVLATPELTVPHPQLQHRRFVLEPLAAVAPNLVHPMLQQTVAELLAHCIDPLPVQKFR